MTFLAVIAFLFISAQADCSALPPAKDPQCLPLPDINCPISNEGKQLRVPNSARLIAAPYNTTDIHDNIADVIDFGRARLKRWLSDCEIEQLNEEACWWFTEGQYGFDECVGPLQPYGQFSLINHFVNVTVNATTGENISTPYTATVTAYPYANVLDWKPPIAVDSGFPERVGDTYWMDGGLIAYPSTVGYFKAGPNAGLQYKPGTYFWYDAWMIVRDNYVRPNGESFGRCIEERAISRTTTYSNIVPGIQSKSQQFIASQIVLDTGDICYYNDPLMKNNGDPVTWCGGNDTLWETSMLMITCPKWTRPEQYGPNNIYWPR